MAYTTINKSTDYFNTNLFTSNGSETSQTGLGFQPDLVWNKSRSNSNSHVICNSVSGTGKFLACNNSDAETTATGTVSSFDSDGFTLSADSGGYGNTSGRTYVNWCWKAGTTSIPSGSTTDPSAVSINTTAGFGIYKITAPSSGNYVLKHGLGATPKMVIVKRTDGNQKWMVWHHTFSNATDDYLQLNDAAAKATYSTCWGTMNSTDCTIATGGTLDTGGEHVIYVFTEKTGYSKFDTYEGNGLTSGSFVYTGFKPSFVMIKNVDYNEQWRIYDSKREPSNHMFKCLFPNANNGENTTDNGSEEIDFVSNGIKLRSSARQLNDYSLIYMAFGQSLVGSNNVPCTAR